MLILAIFLCTGLAFAEDKQDTVTVHLEIDQIVTLREGNVILALYDSEQTLLAEEGFALTRGLSSVNVTFSVPEYTVGKVFLLRLTSGASALRFNGDTGTEMTLQTYSYTDDFGNGVCQTAFYMELEPYREKEAIIELSGDSVTVEYRLVENELFVPLSFLQAIHINCTQKDGVYFLSTDAGHATMRLFDDNIYAEKNWKGYNLAHPLWKEGTDTFVPLAEIAVHFACNYTEIDDGYIKYVSLTPSVYSHNSAEKYINSIDMESRTKYLIWISKSDYMVYVFKGSNRKWTLLDSFPCAIGAPDTPTIEGRFEYIERLNRWTYPDFYCGPVMRFYNGYAIHSTLLRYDDSFYDNRVGIQVSHGCIRVRPDKIRWLVDTIPFFSCIYITQCGAIQ